MSINRKTGFISGLVTLFGLGGLGLSIVVWSQGASIQDLIDAGAPLKNQLLAGLVYGFVCSVVAILLAELSFFRDFRSFFVELVHEIKPSVPEVVFYSFCAGIGEELLFRAGIQPVIGIWPTAILFILLHGYLNPYVLSFFLYGLVTVAISAGFGYLFVYWGIFSAMIAHFIFDLLVFLYLLRFTSDTTPEESN